MHNRTTVQEYVPNLVVMTRKKRVCAYARVSGDRDEAFHSLSAQVSYYQKKIADNPDWEFVEVFSDRGITGTKDKREGFQAMLTACREGKVDIVLAKSITRFARNTVILLETIRELKKLGVDVHFEEEHIETLSYSGELLISILAARAQEESRSASENQLWRIKKSYEQGIPVTGNCLGYRLVGHQFLIDEDEEKIVRRIYSMYLSGMGCTAIAKKLTDENIKNHHGEVVWSQSGIRKILMNEKYVGDLVLQKVYSTDYITKRHEYNNGERPKYTVTDAHDPIIDRETFDKVQAEMKRRQEDHLPSYLEKPSYPFSGLIRCGKCGSVYKHKVLVNKNRPKRFVWSCTKLEKLGRKYCDAQMLPDNILRQKICEILGIKNVEDVVASDYIEKIVVPDKNVFIVYLKDGNERRVEWTHASRSKSWTPEMKEEASRRMREWHRANKEGR